MKTGQWYGTRHKFNSGNLPDDYTDFNTGIYARLSNESAGVACSLTNTTDVCYWNKDSNSFSMKVPHFSGVGSSITGTAPGSNNYYNRCKHKQQFGGSATAPAVTESRTFAIAADSENTYRVSNAEGNWSRFPLFHYQQKRLKM